MNKLAPYLLSLTLVIALVLVAQTSAAVISLDRTTIQSPAWSTTLNAVTIDRGNGNETYTTAQLTNVNLTDIVVNGSPLLFGNGNSIPAAGSRATLIEDWRLDTGIINPIVSTTPSMTADFLAPVVNTPGFDVIVFEFANAGNPDSIRIFINGQSHDYSATDYVKNLTGDITYRTASGSVTDLANLESRSFTLGNSGSGQNIAGLPIDLSDFGVAPYASITSIGIASTNSNTVDPVMIIGLPVPEPASLALLAAGSLLLASRRRR